jgi:hypothetical protein
LTNLVIGAGFTTSEGTRSSFAAALSISLCQRQ